MKKLLYIVLLCTVIFANKVDENVYSVQNLSQLQDTIEKEIKSKQRPLVLLKEELSYIKRIKELSTQKITFSKVDSKEFNKSSLLVDFFLFSYKNISDIELKQQLQNELLRSSQDKLLVLRKNIENITQENKSKLQLYQLQYLYYKTQQNHIHANIQSYEEYIKHTLHLIDANIHKTKALKIQMLEEEKERFLKQIQSLKQTILEKEIELEKEYVLGESLRTRDLSKHIYSLNNQVNSLLEKVIILQIKKLIVKLSQKEQNSFIKLLNQLEKQITQLKLQEKESYEVLYDFLSQSAKKRFGNTQMILGNSLNQTKDLFNQIKEVMTQTLFVFNEKAITFLSLIKAVVLVIIGFSVGIFYKRWLFKLSRKWPNMSQMSLKLSANIGFYIIVLITIMIAMSSLGIDMSSISLIAGALSIGIGFGLQTVVSNFISGIILMFERTIRIGDIVEINELLKGTVTDMRIRSTTIKTFDNIDIVVPNSSFIQNNVINWTLEDASRRLHVPFGVAYGTSVDLVKEVIVKELFASDLKFIRNDEDKKPEIRLENMNSSSVDFELLVWIKANDKLQPNSLKSDFMILIYNTLYKYNIEIPFPQLDLHIKKEMKK